MSKLNLENPTGRKLRVAKNLIILCGLGLGIYLFLHWWNSDSNEPEFEIEKTPIKVERIRAICQLATISYQDEVVVDSIEYYANHEEKIYGNLKKLFDIDQFKHGLHSDNVKRRLTLIVKGEVKIGFDLKDKHFEAQQTDSSIVLSLPKPIITDVISTSANTKVFLENGDWKDPEVRKLKLKARQIMRKNALELGLEQQAENSAIHLFKSLIKTNKKLEFKFV